MGRAEQGQDHSPPNRTVSKTRPSRTFEKHERQHITSTLTMTTMRRRPLPGIRRLTGLLVAATTLSCCLWQKGVDALATGAADCPGGRAAVGGGHLTGGFTQGTLDEGGITILMDGQPIAFDGSNVINFNVGQTHRITIEKTTYFRGFLFRLGGGIIPPPADTITVFSTDSTAANTPPQVGLAAICVSKYGVSNKCYGGNGCIYVSLYISPSKGLLTFLLPIMTRYICIIIRSEASPM